MLERGRRREPAGRRNDGRYGRSYPLSLLPPCAGGFSNTNALREPFNDSTERGDGVTDDPYIALADSRVSMTAYILLESAFCDCDGLCICGWDDG
jgi:hypothetical protein